MRTIVHFFLLLAAWPALGLDVRFWLGDSTGTPQTNRSWALYPAPPQLTNGAGMIVTRDRLFRTTDINGYVTVSNLLAGGYRSEVQGTWTTTTNFYVFPATNGFLNAGDWAVAGSTNLPGGLYAYTIAQADGRFYPLFSNPSNYLTQLALSAGGFLTNHQTTLINADGGLSVSNGATQIHGPLLVDGAGTNGNVTTSPFFTLSSRGILNGLSSRTNDGSNFGPDTPGTTSTGIQEALNAIVVRPQNQSGLWVQMMGGNYYYTNRIVWTNHAGSLYRLDGPSDANTALIYAGPAVTNVSLFTINAIGTLVDPSVVQLNHITFGSLTNIPATLLTITNTSDEMLNRVSFLGKWQGQVTPFVALVGLDIGTRSANVSVIENSFFSQLATGLKNDSDHLHVIRTTFDHNGQVPGTMKNAWTNLASPYAIGAAVFVPPYLPREDNRYIGCHFYSDYVGVAFDSAGITPPGAGGNVQIFEDCVFADTPYQVACNDVANGVAPFQWFGHTVSDNTNASPQGDFSGIDGEDVWDAVFAGPTSAFRGLIFNHGGNYDTNGLPNGAVTNFFPGFTRNTMEQQLGDSPNHYFNAPVIGASGFYGDFSGGTNGNASTFFSSGTVPLARLPVGIGATNSLAGTNDSRVMTFNGGIQSSGSNDFSGSVGRAGSAVHYGDGSHLTGLSGAQIAGALAQTNSLAGTNDSRVMTFNGGIQSTASNDFSGSVGRSGSAVHYGDGSHLSGLTNGLSGVGSFVPLWSSVSVSPSAATTYYVGADMVTGMGTTYSNAAFTITKACTLKGYAVKVRCTAGTSEQVAHAIFINNSTVVGTISNAWNVASVDVYTNGLSQALAAGDTLVLRVQSPSTWATPAVSTRTMVILYVE